MSDRSFNTNFDKIGAICCGWWMTLAAIDPKTGEERSGGKPERGELAQLRRIGIDALSADERIDVTAAFQRWPYRELRTKLGWARERWFQGLNGPDDFDQAVAVVAATLARVRQENPKLKTQSVSALLGAGKDSKPVKDEADAAARVMAEARFKRLVRTRDWPGVLDQGRRIVHLLGRDVPVADLGASLLLWNASSHVIRRWSFEYYGAGFADRNTESADAAA